MTIQPMATAVPVPAVPAGTGEAAAPTDFLAAFLAAMEGTATAPVVEDGASAPRLAEDCAPAAPLVEEGAPAPVAKPAAPADETDETPTDATDPVETQASPLLLDPALVAVVAQQAPAAPPRTEQTGKADQSDKAPKAEKADKVGQVGQVDHPDTPRATAAEPTRAGTPPTPPHRPVGPGATDTRPEQAADPTPPGLTRIAERADRPAAPELAVAGRTAPAKEHATAPAEAPASSDGVPHLPATANQLPVPAPTAPVATTAPAPVASAAPAAAPAGPPVANTTPLDRVSAQVFPEITGLVSRGNGSHRITLTLNPEQLGEVRVVMTMRDGAVHVRMAAGHEARAALLDGSPELSRLLETAGATETRIVVRELPMAAVSPSTPTPSSPSTLLGGDGTPDQHAGTRADHQARDGSDHSTPRPARVEGTIPGPAPRSIQSVSGTRLAGVDLTM